MPYGETDAMKEFNATYKQDQAALQKIDEAKVNPQELGLVISQLQDEIQIIRKQLENLPGYAIGKLFHPNLQARCLPT